MIYFLTTLFRNIVVLWLRLAFWPLLLWWRRRPLVLRLDLPPSLPLRPASPLRRLLGRSEPHLGAVLGLLGKVSRDRAFSGILVTIPRLTMGRTAIAEVRAGLEAIVRAGKEVTVVLREGGGAAELRLAPPGARIVLHPSAALRLEGAAAAPVSIGELLEKLGVRADLEAVGEWKTAPEMFTRSRLSERGREQIEQLLAGLQETVLEDLAATRGVEVEVVRGWIATQLFLPGEAVEAGIVDTAAFDDEVEVGMESGSRVVRPGDAPARARLSWRWRPLGRPVVVGVVSVHGQIVPRAGGRLGGGRVASAARIVPEIEQVAGSPMFRALVVDIDSRGGSTTASDGIYRKVRAVAADRPVVARLGDVAASGGYYIASAAHEILAAPDTITGSIGVFGGKIASDGLLDGLGVDMQRVTLGDPGAGIMLPDRPFDERERALVRREMEAFYETFLDVVASRKGRSRDEVEPLAGGRVWHARAARDVDLVDGVGSRRDLVESLARRLRCRPERIVLRHVGGSGPLEDVGGLSLVESGLLEAADSLRLVGSERMAAELPLYPAG